MAEVKDLGTDKPTTSFDDISPPSYNFYYSDQNFNPLTTSFVEFDFGFVSTSILISNDSTTQIEFSFDGTDIHGRLYQNEVLMLQNVGKSKIYLRGELGGESYRLWVW